MKVKLLALCALSAWAAFAAYDPRKATERPPVGERLFTSSALERKIADVKAKLGPGKLATMFENCYPNTLDTTVHYRRLPDGKDDCFVYTGDIRGMWLRDSSAQVQPYLRFAKEDEGVRRLVRGVLLRQFAFLRIDPYANAFSIDADGVTHDDATGDVCEIPIHRQVFERKYELDSLCYPLRLAHAYWKATGDASIFDAGWEEALKGVLAVMRDQQRRKGSEQTVYGFARRNSTAFQTHAPYYGKGMPCRFTGMVGSVFRPSDDACYYPFLVPSNFFAADVLPKAAEILDATKGDAKLAGACRALAKEIREGLEKFAVREHPVYGKVYCFEVDGLGNGTFMDDANVPSLLALPYIAPSLVKRGDPVYENTRRMVWSEANPFFFKGRAGEGIGSPHTWFNRLWPMSLIVKALTTDDDAEVRACVKMLLQLDDGRNFIHEGVDPDDASHFTRPWFSWANTLFGELIVELDARGRLDAVKGL